MNAINFKSKANGFDSTITLDSVSSKLIFSFDINEFEPHVLIGAALEHFHAEIDSWLQAHYGPDLTTAGGYKQLSEWFGMGSYSLMEIGLTFEFKYSGVDTTLTIY
jgi:hypothetical protein